MSFFRMPKDSNLVKSWIVACKRKELDLLSKSENSDYFYQTYVVCSDHFDSSCLRNKNLFSQGLLSGSIPTQNLFNQKQVTKRRIREIISDNSAKKIKINEDSQNEGGLQAQNSSSFKTSESSNEEINELKRRVDNLRKKLKYKTTLVSKYRKQNQLLRRKLKKLTGNKGTNAPGMTTVCNQFVQSQVRLVGKKEKR